VYTAAAVVPPPSTTDDASSPEKLDDATADDTQERYPLPSVTVDIVAWAVLEADLKVLLIRRKLSPFLGAWALPGGFVRVGADPKAQGEGLLEAAERELVEETQLRPGMVALQQLGVFGPAGRDPRTRVITIAHWGCVRPELAAFIRAGTDAADARWFSWRHIDDVELAFDHATILRRGHRRLVEAMEDEEVDGVLSPERFSIAELRAIHEAVRGEPLDPANFRRRFLARVDEGQAEVTEGHKVTGRRRAHVYRWAVNGSG
jgi:8-oxo-dGTP diphosphatase